MPQPTAPLPAVDAFKAARQAVVEWRREAACNPAEYERRGQLLMRLDAIAAEVVGEQAR